MRRARSGRLLAAALLLPACGGGGGGGPSWSAFFAAIPTSGAGGTTSGGVLAPLALVDTTSPTHTIPVPPAGGDDGVRQALQDVLDGPGLDFVVTFGNAASRTVVLTRPIVVPAGKRLVLDGQGTLTLSGGGATRIVLKRNDTDLTLQRLTFIDGRAAQSGGAIDFDGWEGRLTVIDCTFTNCRTLEPGPDRGGGAIRAWGHKHTQISGCVFTDCAASNGGAVNSLGSQLTIIRSRFERNLAFGTGGGADAGPGGGGGIGGAVYVDNVHLEGDAPELRLSGCVFRNNIANAHAGAVFGYTTSGTSSITTVDACTFSGNEVTGQNGGGGHSGAFYSQNGTRVFSASTFDGNDAAGPAGAVFVTGSGAVGFTNCTFRGNLAGGLGGALFLTGGTNTLTNVTLSGNHSALFAGGIFRGGGVSVTLRNTLVQNNTGTDAFNGWNVNATLTDGGNNLQWPAGLGGVFTPAVAGISFQDAQLQALADNTGPTRTMGLPAGSPAENAGTSTGAPTTDQRGLPRVGAVDVGAFERQ